MIPLSQLLADPSDDEFVPLRPQGARRPASAPIRAFETGLPRVPAETAMPRKAITSPASAFSGQPRPAAPLTVPSRPLASAALPVRAAPAPLRPVTEPRVPLRELEAERQARAEDREAFQEQLDAAVGEARREAEAEVEAVRQDLERVTQARLDELRQELAVQQSAALAETRRLWVDAEGDRLADLVILQMAVFEDALKTTLNGLLRPLVLDARKRQTVDDLAGAVKTIAFDGQTVKIAASGPRDLLDALETKLGDHARHVSFDADESHTDVRIDANQTVIETRLAAWLKAVEEALS
ncbi:hypothetical protein [Aureimonas pseudogalii]|uniref:Uncharacterized protein n=1 Tax=Aureimonas pseudogalii TaxID=1744844 RepID=A0A7W6E7Z9_9HYPH|nr:hypothetical protein [Aureimonas pseudogalii]MBB3996398.1 hypothetical protein [Aureimonas pseudogalii]